MPRLLPHWQSYPNFKGAASARRWSPKACERAEPAGRRPCSYYERFGFSAATAQNIRGPYSGPGWMALELATGALDGVEGSVTYPDAFADVES
jgi:hypothetical protein